MFLKAGLTFWIGGYVNFGNSTWNANVFNVNGGGALDDNNATNSNGVRPELPYYD